jgi:uncharacterized protein (DUF697 family)
MLPIQSAMVITVGHIYGRRLEKAEARDLILELTAVAGASFLARQGIKAILPVLGALLTVPAAFAANWGIGRVAMEYFKNPGLTKDDLRDVFQRAKREGEGQFSRSKFDEFRGRHEAGIREVAKEEEPPPPAPAAEPAAKKKGKTIGRGTKVKGAAAKAPAAAKKSIGKKAKAEPAPENPLAAIIEKELPKRVAAKRAVAEQVKAVVHLDISGPNGGQWTMDLGKPDDPISRGLNGTPKLTVRAAADFFLRLVQGKADAQTAVFTGKLKLDPLDVELATAIGQIFAA